MCKKLIFVLAMVAIVSPAWAFDPDDTYTDPGNQPYGSVWGADGDWIIFKCDIDAGGASGPGHTQPGWKPFEMSGTYSTLPAQSKNFGIGSYMPFVTIDGITQTGGAGQLGGSRDRFGAGVGTANENDFSLMLKDLVFVPHTASGMGKDYLKVTINYGPQMANVNLNVTLWCWDAAFAGSGTGYGGAGEPEGSKIAAWSTTNPSQWLTTNLPGEPNGYGYHSTPGNSNMPPGLAALVGDQSIMLGTAPWVSMFDGANGMTFQSTVNVTLNEYGVVDLYGWADMLSQTGSQHIALNGIAIHLPEPTTIALLGLGGLVLLRKRRN